jgi:Kef-type K+ transport system membrane component KefB
MELSAVLLLQIGVILLSVKALGGLFERFRLPPMAGEVLAGVILGPFALGLVQPSEALAMLSDFGLICLLFLIGLNSEYKQLWRIGGVALAVALGGIILPLVMSVLLIPGPAGLLVGVALTATSISVPVRILSDMRRLESPEGKIVTAASVLDDIIGVLVLAIVTTAGASLLTAGGLALKTVAFLVISLIAAVSITVFWQKRALEMKRRVSERSLLPLFLGVCFLIAWLATQFGIAAAIGAFIAGVIFSELHDKKTVVGELQPFFDVFVPLFFFVIGMGVNLALVPQAGWAALLILFIAIASKVVGCGLPALLVLPPTLAAAVGVSMIPRLEVALIVMGSALSAKLVGADIYSAFVLVAVVTLIIVEPALDFVYAFHPKRHL